MNKLVIVLLMSLFLVACEESEPQFGIMLNEGNDMVEYGENWVDAGAYFTDGQIRIHADVKGEVGNEIGEYYVTYEVMFEGVLYEIQRLVFFFDNTPPEGILNPSVDTVKQFETWVDAGITASDNVSENVEVTVTHQINTSVIGTYEVLYKLTDESGLTTYLIRYVNVIE